MAGILIVDDNEDILVAARLLLKPITSVITESDPNRIPNLMAQEEFDVIFLDMNFTVFQLEQPCPYFDYSYVFSNSCIFQWCN